jgi:cytochrome c553
MWTPRHDTGQKHGCEATYAKPDRDPLPCGRARVRRARHRAWRYLSGECVTCHRTATATTTIPNIFGMAAATMTEAIKAYRDKRLDNAVMQGIAGRLKDDEIEALAAYFEQIKRP